LPEWELSRGVMGPIPRTLVIQDTYVAEDGPSEWVLSKDDTEPHETVLKQKSSIISTEPKKNAIATYMMSK